MAIANKVRGRFAYLTIESDRRNQSQAAQEKVKV
jgi:hypothetical protein